MSRLSAGQTLIGLSSVVLVLLVVDLAQGQYYGRLLPCPRSHMDPDADCLAGVAGKDYPLYSSAPVTSFKCESQKIVNLGYFADVDTQCQVFHVCLKNGLRDTFICPNGTLFNQQFLVCDWWFNVKCPDAPGFYQINDYLETPMASRPGPPPSPNMLPLAANPSPSRRPLLQATASQEARPLLSDSQPSSSEDQISMVSKPSDIAVSTSYSFRPIAARPSMSSHVARPSGDRVNEAVSPVTPVANPSYPMFQRGQPSRTRFEPYNPALPGTVYGSQAASQGQNWQRGSEQDWVGAQIVMPRNKEVGSSSSVVYTEATTTTTTTESTASKSTDAFQVAKNQNFGPWIHSTNSSPLRGLPRSL